MYPRATKRGSDRTLQSEKCAAARVTQTGRRPRGLHRLTFVYCARRVYA